MRKTYSKTAFAVGRARSARYSQRAPLRVVVVKCLRRDDSRLVRQKVRPYGRIIAVFDGRSRIPRKTPSPLWDERLRLFYWLAVSATLLGFQSPKQAR